MAYASKYYFIFHGASGDYYKIDILQDGFSGTAIRRNLGGEPVLRRERNGNICGSSLEFYAECEVDGEFADLYTADPSELQVQLKRAATAADLDTTSEDPTQVTLIWQGFVVTEQYAAPYIDPPYDVKVVATDGLGELKYQTISDGTAEYRTIRAALAWYLGYTGQSLSVYFVNTMNERLSDTDVPDVYIGLGQFYGKTMYEAIEAIMQLLHARIYQMEISGESAPVWMVTRETDIVNCMQNGVVIPQELAVGTYDSLTAKTVGSAKTETVFPIDHMSQTIEAAKKGITVVSTNDYWDAVPNSKFTGTVTLSGTTAYYHKFYIYSEATVDAYPDNCAAHLTVKFRNTSTSISVTYSMAVLALASGNWYGVNSSMQWESISGQYDESTASGTLASGTYGDFRDLQTLEFDIPRRGGSSSYYEVLFLAPKNILEVDSVSLTIDSNTSFTGYKDAVVINNSGRFAADDVDLSFATHHQASGWNQYRYLSNYFGNGYKYWISDNESQYADLYYLSLLARDYALSVALPRLRMEGTVHWPYKYNPFLFSIGGVNFNVETWDWNIRAGEVSFSALSLPAASMTISSETETQILN